MEECAEAGCERAAEFEFYDPATGRVRRLCGDHLAAAEELIEVRSWLLAGYARPLEEAPFERSLPREPVRPEERRAREAVDGLLRGR